MDFLCPHVMKPEGKWQAVRKETLEVVDREKRAARTTCSVCK
jgi:hypothetical protein